MRAFGLLFVVIFLISCGNTADTVTDQQLNGSYYVSGIGGNLINSEEIIFEFSPVGNRISGNTGCNSFSANFRQEGQELNFTTPITTRKYCEGKMEVEREILSSFEEAVKFITSGNEFIFLSEENEELITLTKKN